MAQTVKDICTATTLGVITRYCNMDNFRRDFNTRFNEYKDAIGRCCKELGQIHPRIAEDIEYVGGKCTQTACAISMDVREEWMLLVQEIEIALQARTTQ